MSAIASFIQLPTSALAGLRTVAVPKKTFFGSTRDKYGEYLQQNGRPVAEYPWSGYVLATLLTYLDARGIGLMNSEHGELSTFLTNARGATHFVFTHDQKLAYLDKLSGPFSQDELRDYYNEFNDAAEADSGKPMLDGITAFRDTLAAIEKDSVVLFSIS
jgi:hypothetical protein